MTRHMHGYDRRLIAVMLLVVCGVQPLILARSHPSAKCRDSGGSCASPNKLGTCMEVFLGILLRVGGATFQQGTTLPILLHGDV